MYGQAMVSSSKKQATVALSSCEAEIVAISEVTKKAVYLRALFAELGLPATGPTPLAMDNMSAINLAYNSEHNIRTKHINRLHSFVRERVESLEITVPFVQSVGSSRNPSIFIPNFLQYCPSILLPDNWLYTPLSRSYLKYSVLWVP
eukprot:4923307-Pleurochrysis_carterae.AAC.1